MAQPIQLVPLVCLRCGTRIPANPAEAAWVCENCQQGMYLDEQDGLVSTQIFYHSEIASNQIGKPFCVAEGQVQVDRTTYTGNQDKEAERFWTRPSYQPHLFFVPAYSLPLEKLLEIGVKMIHQPPKLQGGSTAKFIPPVLLRADVKAVAEFIVMAVEAARKDKLKSVTLALDLAEPVLWILP